MQTGHARGAAGGSRDEKVGRLRELLRDERDVAFAYLFGSFAKDRPRSASDVDVAVFFTESVAPDERSSRALALEAALERALGRPAQVVPLNDAPLDLARNVLGHGVSVLTRDEAARRAFYVETGRRYYDMASAREIFNRYRARRIREGRFGG